MTKSKSKYSGNIILASRLFRPKNVGEICLCQREEYLDGLAFTYVTSKLLLLYNISVLVKPLSLDITTKTD